ncbi:MAG: fumarylacetoacetate hydrolase family protein [Fidelibacterota bacterium]
MKLLSYSRDPHQGPRLGFIRGEWVVDVELAGKWTRDHGLSPTTLPDLSSSMRPFLSDWPSMLEALQTVADILAEEDVGTLTVEGGPLAIRESSVHFHPPVPDPPTFRDFYAFEQHVRAARRSRGMEMDPTWYRIPIFYYSNPVNLYGHKDAIPMPGQTRALDFELELGMIIARGGRDIPAEEADSCIGGYTIINDWSARDIQKEEMTLNLGPAKGKDFGTSVGPYLVTPDELADRWEDGKLNLAMKAYRNGRKLSAGNARDLYHSWQGMIERASQNTPLMPGDLFGSGTVGTGCILELKPENAGGWLEKGDVIRLEIERLGKLENIIV